MTLLLMEIYINGVVGRMVMKIEKILADCGSQQLGF
jgi:hypothetical protein